jgi:hypothetical protein
VAGALFLTGHEGSFHVIFARKHAAGITQLHKKGYSRDKGRETKLIQSTNEQLGPAPLLPPAVPASPERTPSENASADRGERRRRRLLATQSDQSDPTGTAADGGENASAATTRQGARRLGRTSGQEGRRRNARSDSGPSVAASGQAGSAIADGTVAEGQSENEITSLIVTDPSASAKKGARAIQRHQKKQQAAEAAVAAVDSEETNPSLGALNRHLNMMMQQLSTAHRVIGRTSAERDALRQQLADLKGVPVEEIHVTTIGIGADEPVKAAANHAHAHAHAHANTATPSTMSKLNIFSSSLDYEVMRRRRQRFVLALLAVVLTVWIVSRFMGWEMPTNLSRDSLGALPFVGDLMSMFLAGWLMYRVVRVSAKGVRWVFPSDDPRRRRHQ